MYRKRRLGFIIFAARGNEANDGNAVLNRNVTKWLMKIPPVNFCLHFQNLICMFAGWVPCCAAYRHALCRGPIKRLFMGGASISQLSLWRTKVDRELASAERKYSRIDQISSEILIGLKQGDHAAFNTIYMAYADPMLRFLRSILKNDEDAKGAVQEVFMSLWAHRENIDPEKNIKNYLYTASRNKAFNLLREYNVRFRYVQEKAALSWEDTDQLDHDVMVSEQTRLIIEAVILKMPPQRRRVFEMSRKEGMPHERIAAELGITTGTVAQHITSALKSIREALALFIFLFYDRI